MFKRILLAAVAVLITPILVSCATPVPSDELHAFKNTLEDEYSEYSGMFISSVSVGEQFYTEVTLALILDDVNDFNVSSFDKLLSEYSSMWPKALHDVEIYVKTEEDEGYKYTVYDESIEDGYYSFDGLPLYNAENWHLFSEKQHGLGIWRERADYSFDFNIRNGDGPYCVEINDIRYLYDEYSGGFDQYEHGKNHKYCQEDKKADEDSWELFHVDWKTANELYQDKFYTIEFDRN